ncbi:MAG: hypothetical protein IIX38_03305, partial [Alistipes sp.]|nr:hypothetical protein [Alistipes sp.]
QVDVVQNFLVVVKHLAHTNHRKYNFLVCHSYVVLLYFALVGKYTNKKRDYEIFVWGGVVFVNKNMEKFADFFFFFTFAPHYINRVKR